MAKRLTGDETYEIGLEWVRLAGFEALISTGRLTDARVIAAPYPARSFLAGEQAPNPQPLPPCSGEGAQEAI